LGHGFHILLGNPLRMLTQLMQTKPFPWTASDFARRVLRWGRKVAASLETRAPLGSLSCKGRTVSSHLPTQAHDAASFIRAVHVHGRPDLEQCLELLLGPKHVGSSFASNTSRRAAWRFHSEELMRLVEPGSRPWAWWVYDAPEPTLPRESDFDYLARCGLLTKGERARLPKTRVQPAAHATRNP